MTWIHPRFWGNSPVRDFRNTCWMPVEISHKTSEINQVFTCCWDGKFIHPSGETFDYMMIFNGETNYIKPINWGNNKWNSPIVGSLVLMSVIITHLHFSPDLTSLKGQEANNFRAFRHVMGDTLKDCCAVLRTETCLLAAYQLITTALARGPEAVSWQEIKAPLFAMRSISFLPFILS